MNLFSALPSDIIEELSYRLPYYKLIPLCKQLKIFDKLCQNEGYWLRRAIKLFKITPEYYISWIPETLQELESEPIESIPQNIYAGVIIKSPFVDPGTEDVYAIYKGKPQYLKEAALSGNLETYKYYLDKYFTGMYMDINIYSKQIKYISSKYPNSPETKSIRTSPRRFSEYLKEAIWLLSHYFEKTYEVVIYTSTPDNIVADKKAVDTVYRRSNVDLDMERIDALNEVIRAILSGHVEVGKYWLSQIEEGELDGLHFKDFSDMYELDLSEMVNDKKGWELLLLFIDKMKETGTKFDTDHYVFASTIIKKLREDDTYLPSLIITRFGQIFTDDDIVKILSSVISIDVLDIVIYSFSQKGIDITSDMIKSAIRLRTRVVSPTKYYQSIYVLEKKLIERGIELDLRELYDQESYDAYIRFRERYAR